MGAKWYVLRTKSRAEYLAADELERDGYEILFPRVKSSYARPGHLDTPLFPGYLFLRCDPTATSWPTFRAGRHILGWIRFDGAIPSIPDDVVVQLMERIEAVNREGGVWRRFRAGETVRIVSKTIQGLAEVIEDAKPRQSRVTILMQFMGRMIRAEVPSEDLQPAEDDSENPFRPPRRTRGGGRRIRGYEASATAGA